MRKNDEVKQRAQERRDEEGQRNKYQTQASYTGSGVEGREGMASQTTDGALQSKINGRQASGRASDGPGIAIIIAAGGKPGSYVKTQALGGVGGPESWIDACMHVRKRVDTPRPPAQDRATGPVAPAGSEQ